MKKTVFTAILGIIAYTGFSQPNSYYKVGDTLYYVNNKASYGSTDTFVIIKETNVRKKKNNYKVDKYILNSKKDSFVLESNFTTNGLGELISDGIYTAYYENGKIYSKGETFNGKKGEGIWTYWYENGKKKSEEKLSKETINDKKIPLVLSFWDKEGNQTVENGNGFCEFVSKDDGFKYKGSYKKGLKNGLWTAHDNDTKLYEEFYKKGKLVKGTSWNANKEIFTYKKIFTKAFYQKEGDIKIRKHIARKFNYRDIAAIGTFLITFIVTAEGDVKNLHIESNGSKECENELKRIFSVIPKWTPAKKRGQSIDSTYSLDVHFN